MFQKAPDPARTSRFNSAKVPETIWNDREEEYTREEMKEMTHSSGERAEKKKTEPKKQKMRGRSLQSLHKRILNDSG